jgi:hypothetical protein
MSISHSDAENAMNTVTSSETAHSMWCQNKGTQRAARTRTALYNQWGKCIKEEENNRLR